MCGSSYTRDPCAHAERVSFVCCGLVSLGCIAVAGAEVILVFYYREFGLGQLWQDSIELLAGGRFKATTTDGWQFRPANSN